MSSRLAAPPDAADRRAAETLVRNSSSVPSAIRRPSRDDADALGHALRHFEDVGRHQDGGSRRGRAPAGSSLTWREAPASSPVSGSSRMMRRGVVDERAGQRHLLAHALGKAARSARAHAAPRPSQSIRAVGVALRGLAPLDLPEAGDEFETFDRRELVVDRSARPDTQAVIRLASIGLAFRASMPKIEIDPASGPQEPGRHPQRCRLAGPVGTEQGVEFAGDAATRSSPRTAGRS